MSPDPDLDLGAAMAPIGVEEHTIAIADRLALAHPPKGEGPYSGIRLTDVVGAMSYALDLAEGQPMGHSVRAAMIGMRLAEVVGLSDDDRRDLCYALLLKDLGCSSTSAELSRRYGADDRAMKQANQLIDWTERRDRARYIFAHQGYRRSPVARAWFTLMHGVGDWEVRQRLAAVKAERGAEIASMLAMSQPTCRAIRAIDEHWDGNGVPTGQRGASIPLLARIACVAQTAAVFQQGHGVATAYDVIHQRSGRWFDPELVTAFDHFRDDVRFWAKLGRVDAISSLGDFEPPERVVYADELRLDTVAEAFAQVIDAKSNFTARHSHNVAFLAVRTARELNLSRREIRAIRRAALLHDVGKLGVSTRVIDKPTELNTAEQHEMRLHSLYTFEILRGVRRFRRFAMIAASHHERLDGRGYHLGLTAEELSLPARVLAVADVCEALAADRPYREGLPLDGVLDRLHELAIGGELCPVAVEALSGWFHGLPSGPIEATAHGDSTSVVI